MVKPKLTFGEWEQCLNELGYVGDRHLSSKDANWKTRAEIQDILGKCAMSAKNYIKLLVDAGVAIASSEVRRNVSGRCYRIPVYKIKPKEFKAFIAKQGVSK